MERVCHGMLLSVKFHLDGEERNLLGSSGQHLQQLLSVRDNPSHWILQSTLPAAHVRPVHRTGP